MDSPLDAVNIKEAEALIARVTKFSGKLLASEKEDVRREAFGRWAMSVAKILRLRGYGALLGDGLHGTPVSGASGAEETKEDLTSTTITAVTPPTDPEALARWRRMERSALALISLTLSPPASDFVDFQVQANTSFAESWNALHELYSVNDEQDEMGLLENYATLRLTGGDDPMQFYIKIVSNSKLFEKCGNNTLATPGRRILSFMTKIQKAPGEPWADFNPTREEKAGDVAFMRALKTHDNNKVQPKFAGKKGQHGGSFSHVGEDKKPCAKCGRKNHTTEEHRGGSKKDKNSKGGKSDNKAGDTDDKKSTGGRCHACGEPGHYAKDCPEFREFLESKKKKKEGASAMHAMVERYDHTTPISMVQMTVSNFLTHEDPSMIYLLNDSGTNRHVVRDSSLLWRYTRETSSLRVGDHQRAWKPSDTANSADTSSTATETKYPTHLGKSGIAPRDCATPSTP